MHPARESPAFSSEMTHMLVEGFDAFGVYIQYWMPLAVLVVGVAIAISVRRG
jgi:hypothetical protein